MRETLKHYVNLVSNNAGYDEEKKMEEWLEIEKNYIKEQQENEKIFLEREKTALQRAHLRWYEVAVAATCGGVIVAFFGLIIKVLSK